MEKRVSIEAGIFRSIFPNKGRYFIRVSRRLSGTTPTVRVFRQGFASTLLEARKLKIKLLNELSELSPAGFRATFAQAVSDYLDHLVFRRTPSVFYREASSIKKNLLPLLGDRLAREIRSEECQLTLDRCTFGRSTQTYKHLRNYLRAIFEHIRRRGWISVNPASDTEIRSVRRKDPLVLSESQVKALLHHLRKEDLTVFYYVAMAIYTCCRAGELRALTFSSVNFQNRTITVSKTFDPQRGMQDRTKNWQSRIVPINVELMEVLKELWEMSQKTNVSSVLPPWKEFDNNEQAKVLKKVCRAMGLPEIRFHDLRATGITLLLDKGVSVPKVMKLVGHKRLSSTEVYLRLAGIDNRGATDSLSFGPFN